MKNLSKVNLLTVKAGESLREEPRGFIGLCAMLKRSKAKDAPSAKPVLIPRIG